MKKPDFKQLKKVITNNDVLIIHNQLSEIEGIKGTKLIYAISRSIDKLAPVVKALSMDECIPKSNELLEYEKEMSKIAYEYSKGKSKNIGNTTVHAFPWDDGSNNNLKEEYDNKVAEVKEKYKETLIDRTESEKEYFSFLLEPFSENIDDYFHKISYEDLEKCEVPTNIKFVLTYLINH